MAPLERLDEELEVDPSEVEVEEGAAEDPVLELGGSVEDVKVALGS
jgi:hypothetical protein